MGTFIKGTKIKIKMVCKDGRIIVTGENTCVGERWEGEFSFWIT
jgi:hypothetical protein